MTPLPGQGHTIEGRLRCYEDYYAFAAIARDGERWWIGEDVAEWLDGLELHGQRVRLTVEVIE